MVDELFCGRLIPRLTALTEALTLAAPTVDELVRNAVANMAIEGFECTPAEIERVRARLTAELAPDRAQ